MKKNAFGPARTEAEEVPPPSCGNGDILVANRHSLISAGTETAAVSSSKRDMVLKALRDPDIRQQTIDMLVQMGVSRTADRIQYEMTKWTPLGYSGAGVAVEIGSAIEHIRPGDLVAYGGEGHADLIRARKNLSVPVPERVTTAEAAFVALGSIALQAVRRSDISVGDVVVVQGLGLVGQLVAQLLASSGVRVIGTDVIPERIELAKTLGMESGLVAGPLAADEVTRLTGGVGADRVILCASSDSGELVAQACAMSRERGRLVVVGAVRMDVPRSDFYRKELDLVISRSYGPGRYDTDYEEHGRDYPLGYVRWTERRNMSEFLRQISAGRIQVKPLVSHEFTMDEAHLGYELLLTNPGECLGILLKYDETPHRNGGSAYSLSPTTRRPSERDFCRMGVIGCGSFARQFHLPNLKRLRNAEFRTLATSTGQSAKEMAERYGASKCTTDVKDLWEDNDVDAVMILTRDRSHAPLVTAALTAGKHVFCEKPLATSEEDCRAIFEAAQASDRLCMTGFNRRFAPLMRRAKDVLDRTSGPRLVTYRVNAGSLRPESWVYDPIHSAGRVVGEVCHFADLFYWLIGAEPVRVSASHVGPYPSDQKLENLSASVDFEDGSVAQLVYTSQGSPLVGKERLEVFAGGTAVTLDDFRRLTVRGSTRIDETHRRQDKGHESELAHFVDSVSGRATPEFDLRDGLRAARVCLAIIDASRDGKSVCIDTDSWVSRNPPTPNGAQER